MDIEAPMARWTTLRRKRTEGEQGQSPPLIGPPTLTRRVERHALGRVPAPAGEGREVGVKRAKAALSKSSVSRVCAAITVEFDAWRERRLDDVELD